MSVIVLLFNRDYRRAMTARLNGTSPMAAVPPGGQTEKLFNLALFSAMGRLAKLDGRVTAGEVKYATTIMQLMGLDRQGRLNAIDCFEMGKQPEADVLEWMGLAARRIGRRTALAHLMLKILARLAFVKGDIRLREKLLLRDLADLLGFNKAEVMQIFAEMQSLLDTEHLREKHFLDNAYSVLQLEPDAQDSDIRRAYLRMMSRYHPDKLMRDNLSEDSLKQAQEMSAAIRSAYETLCGYRKLRI
jgi:DnaJ like chaperone protein